MKRIPVIVLLMASLVCGVLLTLPAQSQQSDLREKINRMVAEYKAAPTSTENGVERAIILDDWANYLSVQGVPIPPLLPQNLANCKAGVNLARRVSLIDLHIEEMALKEKHPNGLGHIRVGSMTGPLVVGEYATIELVYTVGDVPIETDGGLRVGKQFQTDHGKQQTTDPAGDNYLTVSCSNPRVSLKLGTSTFAGVNAGFSGAAPFPAIFVEKGTLQKGDAVTMIFGDRSGGGSGYKIQTTTNDAFILPVYVDFFGKGNFMYMDNPPMQIIGGKPYTLHIVGPSIVEPGEKFPLKVRVEDIYENATSGPVPALDLFVNDNPLQHAPEGPAGAFVIDDVSLSEEGVYYFSARTKDGTISGSSNPTLVKQNPVNRIYWGETHGHTGLADGQGTENGYFKFARDEAFLDFCALSEHDLWLTEGGWQAISEATRKYYDPGKFITFKSYEWTMNFQRGGHHNVFFRDDTGVRAAIREGAQSPTLLYDMLRQNNSVTDVLVVPHCHNPGTWKKTDAELQNLVEIYSAHGSFEYFGQKFLERGEKVGLIAGSDNHMGHPGYAKPTNYVHGGLAAAVAKDRSRDAIFDAMKNRAAYGTTGDRTIIDYALNGAPMGSQIASSDEREVQVTVAGERALDRVQIVKNGETIYSRDCLNGKVRGTMRAQLVFRSATNTPGERVDRPRGRRTWVGNVTVRNANLVDVEKYNIDLTFREAVEQQGNQVVFSFITRGDGDGMILNLENAGPETEIDVHIAASRERTGGGGSLYKPQPLPEQNLSFTLSQLKGGRAARDVGNEHFRDMVELQALRDESTRHISFTYKDNGTAKDGDYYYIRVYEADGNMAWSSPIWVGDAQ